MDDWLNDDSAGLPLRSLANGLTGISRMPAGPSLLRLGRLDGSFADAITEFCAAANECGGSTAVAERARIMGGGVGRDPPGEASRLGNIEASRDCEVWCILEVVEMVEIVEMLECVGDLRSCPCGSRKVGSGDEVDSSRALAGSGETGGKRKSGVARVRPLDVPEVTGDETPPVLLCDRAAWWQHVSTEALQQTDSCTLNFQ